MRAYRFVAVQLLTTLLLFIALNLVLSVSFRVLHWAMRPSAPAPAPAPSARVDFAAYTVLSREQAERFLVEQSEMGQVGFQYEPWVLFRNSPYRGRLLNTDAQGFRRTRPPRAPCPEPVRVFVFGGSTTFGYGISDDYTLTSQLQGHLERRYPSVCLEVSNYGQGFFFSSQELLLFMGLLKDGRVPQVAIFVDGANDTYQMSTGRDVPYFSDTVRSLWDRRRLGPDCPSFDWTWFPIVRLARDLMGLPPVPTSDRPRLVEAERSGTYVAERYKHNVRMMRAVCAEYGVRCRFVWQPTFFNYDRTLHGDFPYPADVPAFWAEAYDAIRSWKAADVLYLGDMLTGVREKVFVDSVHYNEAWNGKIAQRIAEFVDLGPRAAAR